MDELFKKCSKCKQNLPLNYFWKNKSSQDGFQGYCKECMKIKTRTYIINNPEKMKEYNKRHWLKYRDKKIKNDQIRANNRQIFLDSLKTPCVKCGEKRPWVIQFHHKNPSLKNFALGEGKKYHKSKNDIIEESKKCVCLCANCHKEFHYLYGLKPLHPVEDLEEYLKRGCLTNGLI